jgi:hypothetical protein
MGTFHRPILELTLLYTMISEIGCQTTEDSAKQRIIKDPMSKRVNFISVVILHLRVFRHGRVCLLAFPVRRQETSVGTIGNMDYNF